MKNKITKQYTFSNEDLQRIDQYAENVSKLVEKDSKAYEQARKIQRLLRGLPDPML